MGVSGGPDMIQDGLILALDASDRNSYVSGSTTWFDVSGNNKSGSLINGPTFNTGSGGSIVFDGNNDYVSLGTFTGFGSTNRTISVWFRVTALPASSGRIITFPADDTATDTPAFTFNINNTGVLQGGIGGAPYDGYNLNISYTLNTWINICATVVTKTVTFYRNGDSLGSNTSTGIVSTNPIGYLGRYNNNYGQYLTGQIAAVQVYNRPLSSTEVLQNYNALKSRFNL